MGAQRDVLDEMIDEIGRHEPTAVLSNHLCSLDDLSRDALEFIGWQAVRHGALAGEHAPPRVVELIRAGREFHSGRGQGDDSLAKDVRNRLAVIGLLTLRSARHAQRKERL
jgi:hypothetical protein